MARGDEHKRVEVEVAEGLWVVEENYESSWATDQTNTIRRPLKDALSHSTYHLNLSKTSIFSRGNKQLLDVHASEG